MMDADQPLKTEYVQYVSSKNSEEMQHVEGKRLKNPSAVLLTLEAV